MNSNSIWKRSERNSVLRRAGPCEAPVVTLHRQRAVLFRSDAGGVKLRPEIDFHDFYEYVFNSLVGLNSQGCFTVA